MIKAVLDTNQFVSGIIKKESNPGKIMRAWREGKFLLLTSKSIIKEIEKVLKYPHIQKKYHITDKEIREIKNNLNADAIVTPGKVKVNVVLDDSDDDKFIACALEGGADYIVTGDSHLLELKKHKGTKIVTAKQFLTLL